MTNTASAQSDLDEIRQLINGFEPLEPANWPDLWDGKSTNTIDHPRLSLFAGHHGFASGSPESINNYVKSSVEGTATLNRLCGNANMDLRLYELNLEGATQNCLNYSFALSPDEFVKSLAYGMMAVEPSLDLLAASALGNGTQNAAEAICEIHGFKTKISDELLNKKLKDLGGKSKGLDILPLIGGYELSALCGLVIAARLAQIPVLLEGVVGLAVIAILQAEHNNACDHVAITGHINPNISTSMGIPYLPIPLQIPNEAGLTMAYLIPNLRGQIIIQSAHAHSHHHHHDGGCCGGHDHDHHDHSHGTDGGGDDGSCCGGGGCQSTH
jgi:hypothetical protein